MSSGNSKDTLNSCGCCSTDPVKYPEHYNRPGQSAINYRLNTHNGFVKRMLARLSEDQLTDVGADEKRPLASLGTRSEDDPTIAMLDAWAVVADVLTFYQERIANEGYMRTATERRSVLELAHAIGYELNPGVAASTWLAFNADNSPNSPPSATVAKGTQVMSIPGKDELPQVFETTEEIVARAAWNELKPYTEKESQKDSIVKGITQLRLQGVGLGLKAGDGLLIVGDNKIKAPESENWDFRILAEVSRAEDGQYTLVKWEEGLGHINPPVSPASQNIKIYTFNARTALFGKNAADWQTLSNEFKEDYLARWLGSTTNLSASKKGKHIVFAGSGNSLRILKYKKSSKEWEETTVYLDSELDTITSVAVSGTGNTIALGHADGALSKVRKDNGQWIVEPVGNDEESAHTSEISRVVYSENGNYAISVDIDNVAKAWNYSQRNLQETYVPQMLTTVGDTRYRVGSEGEALSRWEFTSEWVETTVSSAAHDDIVSAMAISANATRIVSGSADGTLKLWTLNNGSWSSQEFTAGEGVPAHDESIVAVAFSNDAGQTEVISTSVSGVVRRWNRANKTLIRSFKSETLDYLSEWPDYDLPVDNDSPELVLDEHYPGIVGKSWLVLHQPSYIELYNIVSAEKTWYSQFNISSDVTRVELDNSEHLNWFKRRQTTVYGQSVVLDPYAEPVLIKQPVEGNRIELNQLTPELEVERMVVVTGKRMRVRVVADNADLAIESADGLTEKSLSLHDKLVVVARPKPKSGGGRQIYWRAVEGGFKPVIYECTKKDKVGACGAGEQLDIPSVCDKSTEHVCPVNDTIVWELCDRNGFTGSITTEVGAFLLTLAEEDDEEISETLQISHLFEARHDDILVINTLLEFNSSLVNIFDHDTVKINANVAPATHGETTPLEVMGSGDGTRINQRFTLNKTPLTYISAPTPSGGESTLEVRVNDVLWSQVDSLYQQGPRSKVYAIRHDDDGNSIVIFGDGKQGARLPTGQENITASYRSGIGLDGEVNSGQLKLLKSKPLGIREVNNPLPATGAAPPESLSEARSNAPLTVLTLDRIVSVNDFEDFASAFAGVGKAQAAVLWNGEVNVVHITIATASGGTVDKETDILYSNLVAALDRVRDTTVPVLVDGFAELHFTVDAQLLIDPAYIKEKVQDAVKAALLAEFTFEKRNFGQGVNEAEVLTVINNVEGVLASDLVTVFDENGNIVRDKLDVVDGGPLDTFDDELNMKHLRVKKARFKDDKSSEVLRAQLLLISTSPEAITLTEMPS